MKSFEAGLFPLVPRSTGVDDAQGLAAGVVQQLEMALTVGLLKDGDKLPSETDLASQMSVSTVTLRQALTTLRHKGTIVTRRGRNGGSFIQESGALDTIRVDALLRSKSVEELRDLGDVWASVAGAAARLSALRALPDDVDRLERLAAEFSAAHSFDDCRRADSRFHIEVGVAAQSPRLTALLVQLQGEVAPLLWPPGSVASTTAVQEHASLLVAIRHRDEAAAQRAAIAHCERETRFLIDRHLTLAAT